MGVLNFRSRWRTDVSQGKKWLLILPRMIPGLVFMISGLGKVFEVATFFRALSVYAFLPDWSVSILAVFLPVVEYFLGACLMLGLWLRWAVPALIGLLGIFSGALVYRLVVGAGGSCGCSGGLLPELGGRPVGSRVGVGVLILGR